ncbi:MAG: hypothetical protein ABFD45_07325 [Smithella sp.]|jgi:hypothetical protein
MIVLLLTGCASSTVIMINQEKYSPSFSPGDFSRYRGKKLFLSDFFNRAKNTKTYHYYSPDKQLAYEGNATLENFYWHCFQKSFRHIGVHLVDTPYDKSQPYAHDWWGKVPNRADSQASHSVPEFQFIFLSMTDQEFKFKVLVLKGGESKFDKEYTVNVPVATTDDVAELEKRAYKLVELAFTTILNDPDFQI